MTRLPQRSKLRELERQVMAHRFLYYVLSSPILTDAEYDALERDFLSKTEEDSPVRRPGSDLESSYTKDETALALYLKDVEEAYGRDSTPGA